MSEGYKNYSTWLIALHINNDQGLQEEAHQLAADAKTNYDAGQAIKDLIENVVFGFDDEMEHGMVRDLLTASLSFVNWTEIGLHFVP